jgi:hypothetical protein
MAATELNLISIEEAADLFGKSVPQMRQYKSKGLLKVADCIGNKDLFDAAEVILLIAYDSPSPGQRGTLAGSNLPSAQAAE